MAEESKADILAEYDLNAKWDACIDLGVRRCVYSSLAGAFTGLLLFRSPVTRWVTVAFGAGVGIGSAYSECSQKLNKSSVKFTPGISDTSPAKVVGRGDMTRLTRHPTREVMFKSSVDPKL